MKKIIPFLLLFCFPVLSAHATDPSVLNGYWYLDSLESQLIRYPYIWKMDGYKGVDPSISFSQMRLIKSEKMYFLFLQERQAIAIEHAGYFGNMSESEDLEYLQNPYSLVRFTVTNDIVEGERFIEETCTDDTLNKRRDLMGLNDKALSDVVKKSTCHDKSKKWAHNKYSFPYKRPACRFLQNMPWFFTIIAPEFLPCNHEYYEQ